MRSVPMCFSILQVSRYRFHTLANFWQESFHSFPKMCGNHSRFRLLGKANGPEEGYSGRLIRRSVITKKEGTNKLTKNSTKSTSITHEILDEAVSTSATLNVNKVEISEYQKFQYCNIQQKIVDNEELAKLVTVFAFDLETTGFSRENDGIIEIALQDLQGGENSTFQTLVNPEHIVPNSHVHGITTRMVCMPGVPRMKELIPILLQYIDSRQKPGDIVLLVAHNSRTFDVPFFINEFKRCGVDIPFNWLFMDTLPSACESMKSEGSKIPSASSF